MPTLKDLLEKLEGEVHGFVRPYEEVLPESDYFKELPIILAVQRELETIPHYDAELSMLMEKDNILHSVYKHWQNLDPQKCSFDPDNFCELTYDYLTAANYEYRSAKLYEKASTELSQRLEELQTQTPEKILEAAYEVTLKRDILILFEGDTLDQEQVDVLLTLEHPLDSVYQEWLDNDLSHMDLLRDTMTALIDTEQKELKQHSYDVGGEIPDRLKDYYAVHAWDDDPPGSEDESTLER